MLERLRIGTRLLLGFGILVMLVAGLGGFALYSGRTSSALFAEVAQLKDNEVLIQRVVKRVFEGRMQVIAALALRDETRWQKFDAAFRQAHKRLDELVQLTKDSSQFGMAQEMGRLIRDFEEKAIFLRRFDDVNAVMEDVEGNEAIHAATEIGRSIDVLGNELTDRYEKAAIDMTQRAEEKFAHMIYVAAVLAAVCVLSGASLSFFIARSIARPVRAISDVMGSLAAGDLSVDIPSIARHGELGKMAEAIRVFKETAMQTAALRREEEQAKEQGRARMRWWMKGEG